MCPPIGPPSVPFALGSEANRWHPCIKASRTTGKKPSVPLPANVQRSLSKTEWISTLPVLLGPRLLLWIPAKLNQRVFPSFESPSAKDSLKLLYLLIIWGRASFSGHHASALPLWVRDRVCGVRGWGWSAGAMCRAGFPALGQETGWRPPE